MRRGCPWPPSGPSPASPTRRTPSSSSGRPWSTSAGTASAGTSPPPCSPPSPWRCWRSSHPGHHLVTYTVLAAVAQVAGTTSAAAADGLMALTTRDQDKGKAGGFRMAGNVGFTGVLGAVALWVARPAARCRWPAWCWPGVTLLALLPALRIDEVAAAAMTSGHTWLQDVARKLGHVLVDVWHTVASRDGWTGLVICACSVGAGALTNLFTAMANDYHASENLVAMVNGLGGGLVGALGALVGGVLADRMNRRLAYALSGALTAGTALAEHVLRSARRHHLHLGRAGLFLRQRHRLRHAGRLHPRDSAARAPAPPPSTRPSSPSPTSPRATSPRWTAGGPGCLASGCGAASSPTSR